MASANGDPNRHRILVVEQEPALAAEVVAVLRGEGYDVSEVRSVGEALAAVEQAEPELVVADWLLPDGEGLQLARMLRVRGVEAGVLFLAPRDASQRVLDRLRAQDFEYVVKPPARAELVACAGALFRRAGRDLPGEVLRFEDIVVDDARHEVFRGDHPLALTGREFALLRYFVLNARLVLSKRQILEHVWEHDTDAGSNVVETYVSYLRKKLNAAGPPVIRTIRQGGYVLDAERE